VDKLHGAGKTGGAQRLDHELMRSAVLPASGAIPVVDLRRVRHRRNAWRGFDTSGKSPLSPKGRDVVV
jgi:hypothetical protein